MRARWAMGFLLAAAALFAAATCEDTGACGTPLESLRAFWAATGGDGWVRAADWTRDDMYCEWPGVTCDETGGVIGIAADGFGLEVASAAAFDALLCFPELTAVSLSYNALGVEFPPALCAVPKLKFLTLDEVGLTGALPRCLCDMYGLQYLSAVNNDLHGPLLPCLSALPGLKGLNLAYNALSGVVDPLLVENQFLEALSLKCNRDLDCNEENLTFANDLLVFSCGWSLLCATVALRCCKK